MENNVIELLTKDVSKLTDDVSKIAEVMDHNTSVFNRNFTTVFDTVNKLVKKNKRLRLGIVGLTVVGAVGVYAAYQKYQQITKEEDNDNRW